MDCISYLYAKATFATYARTIINLSIKALTIRKQPNHWNDNTPQWSLPNVLRRQQLTLNNERYLLGYHSKYQTNYFSQLIEKTSPFILLQTDNGWKRRDIFVAMIIKYKAKNTLQLWLQCAQAKSEKNHDLNLKWCLQLCSFTNCYIKKKNKISFRCY